MSDTLFKNLLVDKAPWHKRLGAALRGGGYITVWMLYVWVALMVIGTVSVVWGGEAGLEAGVYPLALGLSFLCVFGTVFLWNCLGMRPTFGSDRALSSWSLESKLKDSQVIAAERMGRFELAALLSPEHYQVLAIDRDQKRMYNFVLNPFLKPERALHIVGEKLEKRAAQYDKARREEEAKERVAKQLAEKILADI